MGEEEALVGEFTMFEDKHVLKVGDDGDGLAFLLLDGHLGLEVVSR